MNYQKELEKILERLESDKEKDKAKTKTKTRTGTAPGGEAMGGGSAPTLFLHSCCAPCSSYVLEYLSAYFKITVFYYNPNITEREEYLKRVEEQKRLIEAFNAEAEAQACQDGMAAEREQDGIAAGRKQDACTARKRHRIDVIEGDYAPRIFFDAVKGLEQCKEGGKRCFRCYELRLAETVRQAALRGTDYVTTTLTISPLKNAEKLNEIGERLAEEAGIAWLPSDFKKKNGYKRSVELSAEYGLYRQNYCGCVFSKAEEERREEWQE